MFTLFSDTALAQAQAAGAKPSLLENLFPLIVCFAVFYFLMILPQQRRAKQHQAFLGGLKAGDEVVTTGGIIGRVKTVQDSFVSLEVAANTVIKVIKSEISGATQKAAPAGDKA